MKKIIIVVENDKSGRFVDARPYTVLTEAMEQEEVKAGYQQVAEVLRNGDVFVDDTGETNKLIFKRGLTKGDRKVTATSKGKQTNGGNK